MKKKTKWRLGAIPPAFLYIHSPSVRLKASWGNSWVQYFALGRSLSCLYVFSLAPDFLKDIFRLTRAVFAFIGFGSMSIRPAIRAMFHLLSLFKLLFTFAPLCFILLPIAFVVLISGSKCNSKISFTQSGLLRPK